METHRGNYEGNICITQTCTSPKHYRIKTANGEVVFLHGRLNTYLANFNTLVGE